MSNSATGSPTFVVTDVELDGQSPLRNSMLSFASVAIGRSGAVLDEFEAVLTPRRDRSPDSETTAWWATEPEAYAEATRNPEPPDVVMPRYVGWVRGLPWPRVFASRPLILDGVWIDHYLDSFTNDRVLCGPRDKDPLFDGSGLDLPSFSAALFGMQYVQGDGSSFPAEWYGDIPHSHRAIDDARGYANVLAHLLQTAESRVTQGVLS